MDKSKMTIDQRAAVEDRGGTLLVSAAAGSGKTMVLVGRLMDLICDPQDPRNISDFLIITYTRAAAAELRAKISAELSSRLAQEPENRHLQRQLSLVYLAQISTVHAFCSAILKEYAWQVDLAPDFRVAEERDCAQLKQTALEELLEDRYARPDPDFVQLADTLGAGRNDDALIKLVLKVYDAMNTHPDPEAWLASCQNQDLTRWEQTPWCRYLLQDLKTRLSGWKEVLERAAGLAALDPPLTRGYLPSLQASIAGMEEVLRAAESGWDALHSLPQIQDPKSLFPRLGSARSPDPDLKAQVAALRDSCKEAITKLVAPFAASSEQIRADLERTAPALRGLFRLTADFAAAYARRKSRADLLDFSDLEHEALHLLTRSDTGTPTQAAREIARRYTGILVDEYQDTNAVQDAIFTAVSQQGQNLFFVGDVKQSIYRFRLADPTIFLEKYRTYAPADQAAPGQPRRILLSQNFRSRPEVLEAANAVFSAVMSPLVGGLAYGEAEALALGASYRPRPVPTELHVIDSQVELTEEAEEGPGRQELEARFVARRVRQLLDQPFLVQEGEELRPVRSGDIVILLRSPSGAGGTFQKALEAQGIPCVTDKGGTLLQAPEVQVLLAYLRILDNPRQDIPLAAVLASPVFGFTADDLAELRLKDRENCLYDALTAAAAEQPKAQAFLEQMISLRRQALTLPLGRLVWTVLQNTEMETIYAMGQAGAARRSNLLTIFHLACQFESGGSQGLNGFLSWLEAQADTLRPASAQRDAVSILSIHKSKGLEYPVVILADLSRKFNTADVHGTVLLHPTLGAGARAIDLKEGQSWPTAAHQAVADSLLQEMKSEELRVLYVAMTRAKEKLIMVHCCKNASKLLKTAAALSACPTDPVLAQAAGNLGEWVVMHAVTRPEAGELWAAGELHPEQTVMTESPWDIRYHSGDEVLAEQTPSAAAAVVQTEQADQDPEELAQALTFRYPYAAATRLPTKRTATQLKGRIQDQEAAQQAPAALNLSFPRPQFSPAPLTAAQRGTAVHLAMQYGDYQALSTPEGARQELKRLEAQGYLTAQQAQAVDPTLLVRFFASDLGRRTMACPNLVREFKFSLLTDGAWFDPEAAGEQVMLQGMVDCCLVEPEGLTIIDFKTDRIRPGQEAQRAEAYRIQLQAYGEALSRIFQKPVKEKVLFFFFTGNTYVFAE